MRRVCVCGGDGGGGGDGGAAGPIANDITQACDAFVWVKLVCSTGEYRDYAGLLEHGRNYKRKSFILIPKLCSLS